MFLKINFWPNPCKKSIYQCPITLRISKELILSSKDNQCKGTKILLIVETFLSSSLKIIKRTNLLQSCREFNKASIILLKLRLSKIYFLKISKDNKYSQEIHNHKNNLRIRLQRQLVQFYRKQTKANLIITTLTSREQVLLLSLATITTILNLTTNKNSKWSPSQDILVEKS